MFEIGASLREARIKRNLSPADVQEAIRIRDRYLQALEDEHWDVLPGEAYVKGFLRTYADFLGLDGNLYVDEYNSRLARQDEPVFVPAQLARVEGRRGGIGLLRPLLAIGVIGIIVALVAAVAAGWQLNGSSSNKQGTPPTTTHDATTHSNRPKEKHPRHVSVPLPSRAVLVATRGTCWLEVRRGNLSGSLLYENTLQQGQTLPVNLKNGPVWIDVGDPPNLDVRLGGKLVHGLPAQAGTVLLTRHGIRPA